MDTDMDEGTDLPAGDFSAWRTEMKAALRGERPAAVPCAGCTACCTSSQFVHIAPDETDTLARIPSELLFPAPLLPAGHVVLGYDDRGHCPMLGEDGCSIYDHRPRTCRSYDCRIFPATGLKLDDADKSLIAERSQRWRFSYPDARSRLEHEAVMAAARYLGHHPEVLPEGTGPISTTRLAALAMRIHELFLELDGGTLAIVEPEAERVRLALSGAPW